MKLRLIRHGETEANRACIVQGQSIDSPLTKDLGEPQARAVGTKFRTEFGKGCAPERSKFFSSDLTRAYETGRLARETWGVEVSERGGASWLQKKWCSERSEANWGVTVRSSSLRSAKQSCECLSAPHRSAPHNFLVARCTHTSVNQLRRVSFRRSRTRDFAKSLRGQGKG